MKSHESVVNQNDSVVGKATGQLETSWVNSPKGKISDPEIGDPSDVLWEPKQKTNVFGGIANHRPKKVRNRIPPFTFLTFFLYF
jgi:hypothetical protein